MIHQPYVHTITVCAQRMPIIAPVSSGERGIENMFNNRVLEALIRRYVLVLFGVGLSELPACL